MNRATVAIGSRLCFYVGRLQSRHGIQVKSRGLARNDHTARKYRPFHCRLDGNTPFWSRDARGRFPCDKSVGGDTTYRWLSFARVPPQSSESTRILLMWK